MQKMRQVKRLKPVPLPLMAQSKKRGEVAELRFAAKAASLGLAVAKPYGENDKYDFIVGQRVLRRVQVRSSIFASNGGFRFGLKSGSAKQAMPSGAIDCLAAYVYPEDVWYVIPASEVVHRTAMHVFPSKRNHRGK